MALVLGATLGILNLTSAQSLTWLGILSGHESGAYGVSADGSVIVGWATDANGFWRAFRWTEAEGMQELGTLGGSESGASGVSADGSVVVGKADNASGQTRSFRWTQSEGMQDLGTLGGRESRANGVSVDGSVVVGEATDAYGRWRAFRWTAEGGMKNLGTFGGRESWAHGVSADGSIVVGEATDASGNSRAFRWTQVGGIEDLNQTYASLLADGSELWDARAISPDGRYIVGRGYNAATGRLEAYLLDMGAPSLSRIRGNIALNDFGGDVSQVPVQVELRGDTTQVLTIYPDTNGDYTISDVQLGTYDIAFKASHWLRVVVPGVEVSGAEGTVNVALTNGDVDGDNEVTLFDFGALVAAFGSMPGDSNWNADADLDGDEEVTLFDFGFLVRNFDAIGDE